MTRWRETVLGTRSPAVRENVIDTMRDGPDGLVPATPASTMLAVLAGDVAAKPDYEAMTAPALALYSSKDVAEQVPPGTAPDVRRAIAEYETHSIRPWMLREQADFLEHKRCGIAAELPHSSHYFFLTRPQWTAGAILQFLASSDPCHWVPAAVPPSS
jgi:pimeloyl-ACP methyl ester carboxylesterase